MIKCDSQLSQRGDSSPRRANNTNFARRQELHENVEYEEEEDEFDLNPRPPAAGGGAGAAGVAVDVIAAAAAAMGGDLEEDVDVVGRDRLAVLSSDEEDEVCRGCRVSFVWCEAGRFGSGVWVACFPLSQTALSDHHNLPNHPIDRQIEAVMDPAAAVRALAAGGGNAPGTPLIFLPAKIEIPPPQISDPNKRSGPDGEEAGDDQLLGDQEEEEEEEVKEEEEEEEVKEEETGGRRRRAAAVAAQAQVEAAAAGGDCEYLGGAGGRVSIGLLLHQAHSTPP